MEAADGLNHCSLLLTVSAYPLGQHVLVHVDELLNLCFTERVVSYFPCFLSSSNVSHALPFTASIFHERWYNFFFPPTGYIFKNNHRGKGWF